MKKIIASLAGIGLAVALMGCSGYSAEPDQVGVHVNGYLMLKSDKKILNCFGVDGKDASGYDGAGDGHYYYPAGQRTYKFGGEGADGPAITVVKDSIPLTLSGTVTFHLNTDCDVLKKFHQQIGIKRWGKEKQPAWISDGGDETYYGWDAMLDVYIEQTLQRAATDALVGEQTTYLELYNGAARASLEQGIQEDLPRLVESFAGGPYFENFTVQIQKPDIPGGVADALTAKEIAKAQNEAQKLANQTVQTELESIKQVVAVLGEQGYIDYQRNKLTAQQLDLLKEAIASGQITILPVPTGSNVTIPVPSR